MHRYARLRPGPGFRADRTLLYYTQRMVTNPVARAASRRAIASGINILHRKNSQPSNSAQTVAETLKTNGCSPIGPLLSQEAAEGIRRHLLDKPVLVGSGNKECLLSELPAGTSTVNYSLKTVLECDPLMQLANHPYVLEIASAYLGCNPTISSIGLRWSFPRGNGLVSTQHFHRDCDDWKFFKLFIYLTDVDLETGPHVYIQHSHETPTTMLAKHYDEAQLHRDHAAENFRTFIGPAGTTFLCDTYGIHKGMPPIKAPRLIYQVQYSLLPIYAFEYDPVKIAGAANYNRYINRLMMREAN